MSTSAIGAVSVEVCATLSGQRVAISGRIDVHTVPDVRLVLHEIIDAGCGEVHVALRDAEIGDATGLGVLVEAYTRARRAGRRLGVVEMTDRTARLLRASRLDRALVLRSGGSTQTVVAVTA